MFGCMKGNIHSGHLTHLASPESSTIDYVFCFDISFFSEYSSDPSLVFLDPLNLDVFKNACSPHLGALCQSSCRVNGVGLAVFREENRSAKVIDVQVRICLLYTSDAADE